MKRPSKPCLIRTNRLTIRPHRKEDILILNKAINDSFEILHQWMEWAKHPQTLSETEQYIELSQKWWSEETPEELPLLIFDTNENNLIGSTGYCHIGWEVPKYETGYWVNVAFTGKGYMSEATNGLTRYAFEELQAKRLEIRCDPDNAESAKIPKNLGFALEAQFKNDRVQSNGKLSGTLVFARYDSLNLPDIGYQLK